MPYIGKLENYSQAINDLFLLIFYIVISINEVDFYRIEPENLAIVLVRLVLIVMCFNILMNILQAFKSIVNLIKRICKSRHLKVIPIHKTTIEINFEKEQ